MLRSAVTPLRKHPVLSYFLLTFTISWICAFCVAAPQLLRRQPLTKLTGILMFPAMLLGPSLTGIILTRIVDGRSGLRNLCRRIFARYAAGHWYAVLLMPPALVLAVLLCLQAFVSPVYAPNLFLLGVFFGVPAGFLEEIGWTGYAFPKMRLQNNAFGPSVLLGLLWAAWHLPVVNYLGAATPHGSYWLPFFLVFAAAMTAMRVLICWLYNGTESVLMAQLMHVSSTSSLVVFSAPRVTPAQEVFWYAVYAAALWIVVGVVTNACGMSLRHSARTC